MTMHSDQVLVEFQTGHRLPHLGGKCTNLHGHSWRAEVTVSAASLGRDGIVVEFGAFKAALTEWVDKHLDHGFMLGAADEALPMFEALGSKVYLFEPGPPDWPDGEGALSAGLYWPTVENVAVLLSRVATSILMATPRVTGAVVTRVLVQETPRNAALWERGA